MTKRARQKNAVHQFKLITNEIDASANGAQRKKNFTLHDIYKFDPLTRSQQLAFEFIDSEPDCGVVLSGCPGTGKTFIAIYRALELVLSKETCFKKIVIVRSTAQSRDMGFLPGEKEEKIAPFEKPYIKIFDTIFKFKKSYENMKEAGIVEFESTSFLRGNTMDDTIIIFDEFQNTTYSEACTVASRLGERSKLIISGDLFQSDLKKAEKDEARKFLELMMHMPMNDVVEFGPEDIVRSGYVKELIKTQLKLKHI